MREWVCGVLNAVAVVAAVLPYCCGAHNSVFVRGRFAVPSTLAYGDEGRYPFIPPKAALQFTVQLIDFWEPGDEELHMLPTEDGSVDSDV